MSAVLHCILCGHEHAPGSLCDVVACDCPSGSLYPERRVGERRVHAGLLQDREGWSGHASPWRNGSDRRLDAAWPDGTIELADLLESVFGFDEREDSVGQAIEIIHRYELEAVDPTTEGGERTAPAGVDSEDPRNRGASVDPPSVEGRGSNEVTASPANDLPSAGGPAPGDVREALQQARTNWLESMRGSLDRIVRDALNHKRTPNTWDERKPFVSAVLKQVDRHTDARTLAALRSCGETGEPVGETVGYVVVKTADKDGAVIHRGLEDRTLHKICPTWTMPDSHTTARGTRYTYRLACVILEPVGGTPGNL